MAVIRGSTSSTQVVQAQVHFQVSLATIKEDLESDVDSLENARVTSSDDDEFVQTTISRKNPVSNHRVVQKSSPRKVGFDQELPTKRLVLHICILGLI